MTPYDVSQRLAEVADHKGDNERRHIAEDELLYEVLEAIADGADNPAELARLALTTKEADYARWYA